ncbi:sodium:solute symporter family protein [Desulfurispira natronophila]|uniref:SSS family solute:Na+ symporter n=1 Tax=Desulfurispira natronophila TaxID=682562 RepID=A0A7W7Y4J1_9BACT|nr:hypothetical protein [Desulfurispira natronophila]MBB5021904.1 SSS family solute:Na+ symporter [Desulfurispira natronophila]
MTFSVLFVLVFSGFILIGWRCREASSSPGWLYASKSISTFSASLSTAATTIGGSATIVLAHMVYNHGISGILIDIPIGIGLMVFGLFFARKLRESGADTLAHYITIQYGPAVGKVSAIFIILTGMAWFGLLIRSFTMFLPPDFFLQGNLAIMVAGVCFLIYIFFSGQRGVFYTDIIQAAIIVMGFVIIGITLFFADHSYQPAAAPEALGTATQIAFFIMMFLSGLTGPDVSSRALYARNVASARRGLLFGGIIKVTISATIAYIAWKSLTAMAPLSNSYLLFPTLIDTIFASPMDAILRIMFLLVMISSADTVLMTAVTTLNRDLCKQALSLTLLKVVSFALGTLGIMLALYFSDILDMMRAAYTFYAAGPAMLVLYAYLNLRLRSWGAMLIIVTCGCLALALELSSQAVLNPVLTAVGLNVIMALLLRDSAVKG